MLQGWNLTRGASDVAERSCVKQGLLGRHVETPATKKGAADNGLTLKAFSVLHFRLPLRWSVQTHHKISNYHNSETHTNFIQNKKSSK